jgi:hypothetical protein
VMGLLAGCGGAGNSDNLDSAEAVLLAGLSPCIQPLTKTTIADAQMTIFNILFFISLLRLA